jgi:hypothetical protein
MSFALAHGVPSKSQKTAVGRLRSAGASLTFRPNPPMPISTQHLLGWAITVAALSSGCAVFVTGEDFPYEDDDASVGQPAFPALPAGQTVDAAISLGLPPVVAIGITGTAPAILPGTTSTGSLPSPLGTPISAPAHDAGSSVLTHDAGSSVATGGSAADASAALPTVTPSTLDAGSPSATSSGALTKADAGTSGGSARGDGGGDTGAAAAAAAAAGASANKCVASSCTAFCGLLPPCCNASNQCGCATIFGTCLPPLPPPPLFP